MLSISLIVGPSLLGAKSMIRFIMDTKLFNFIAKISFCTYLIHLTVMYDFMGNRSADFYYEIIPVYNLFAAHTVLSMFLGFIMTVIIEIPFAKLQKLLMSSLMKSKNNSNKEKENNSEHKVKLNETIVEESLKK